MANKIRREQDKFMVVFFCYIHCPSLQHLTAQGLSELEISTFVFKNTYIFQSAEYIDSFPDG